MSPPGSDDPVLPATQDFHSKAMNPEITSDLTLGSPEGSPSGTLSASGSARGAEHTPASVSIPGYVIEGELGRGGVGVVYRARHLALKRPVALKMVLSGRHAGVRELARFRIENEAAARLQHPNIVQIYEVGETGGLPYCAMELTEGGSLAGKLAGKPLPGRPAAELVEPLARAMHLAHSRNIVHRDLKPANVVLAIPASGAESVEGTRTGSALGTPKITDFGLARFLDTDSGQTQAGAVMGTPSYMAPEQASGLAHEAGPAADVYALGAILYECLTGRPPFQGETIVEILDRVRKEEPIPPSRRQPGIPADLETICLKCLRKEPERRYASAAELADDLARYLGDEPILARPVGMVERGLKWAKRRPAFAALCLVLLLSAVGLIGGGIAFTLKLDAARQAAERATRRAERGESDAREQTERAEKGEKDAREQAQLARREQDLARRYLLTTQLLLVGSIFERDPGRALALLEDTRMCPPALRDAGWAFYWHACRRWQPVHLVGHSGAARCLAFSPDGKLLASGGAEGAIRLWDVAEGKLLAGLEGPRGEVVALAFSPDGKVLASGGGPHATAGQVQLWDVAGRRPLSGPIARPFLVSSLSFGKDSRTLVTASFEGTVVERDLETGKEKTLRRGAKPGHTAVVLGPAGGCLATSGGVDQKIKLWQAPWAKERLSLDSGPHSVFCMAFSSDGKLLAGGRSTPAGSVVLWDTASGKLLLSLDGYEGITTTAAGFVEPHGYLLSSGSDGVQAVAFSRDGSLLASAASDGLVRLWDLPSGQERISLRGKVAARALAFAPDGKRLATANADGSVHLWPLVTDRVRVSRAPSQHLFGFAPDGKTLAVASGEGKTGAVDLWDVVSDQVRPLVKGFPSSVESGSFSPDGSAFAVIGTGGVVRVVDVATGVERFRGAGLTQKAMIAREEVALGPGGRTVAWSDADTRVRDLSSGREMVACPGQGWPITFGPDGRLVALGLCDGKGPGKVVLWDTTAGKERAVLGGPRHRPLALAFSRDGRALAAAFSDDTTGGGVRVWEVAEGRQLAALEGHKQPVFCLAFSPDGKTLATGSADGTAKLWDLGTSQERATIKGPVHRLAFSADGKTLALVGPDGAVRLWDVGPPG